MPRPVPFEDRSRPVQIILGVVAPAVLGAIAGVILGVSSTGYWLIGLVAAIGGLLAGFEHRGVGGGAIRGVVGGAIYGTALLLTHAIAGTRARVSLGSAPPLLAVITAIIGMFLGAGGSRIARRNRRHVPEGR